MYTICVSAYIETRCTSRFFNRPKSPQSPADQPQISRAALEGSRAPLSPYRATPSWTDASPVYQRPAPLHDFDTNSSPRRRQEPGVYPNTAAVVMGTRCGCWCVIASILQMTLCSLFTNFRYAFHRRTTIAEVTAVLSDCV